jgi:hypothetical protein
VAPSAQTRDAGVRRVSRLTRWALAGAVGLTAAVSFVVAKAQAGSATNRTSGDTPRSATTVSPAAVIIGPGTGDGLQPPVTPPLGQSGGGGGGGGGGGVATSGGS